MENTIIYNEFASKANSRKHISQMSQQEKNVIAEVLDTSDFGISVHAKERMRAKDIPKAEVFEAIKHGSIVEANKLDETDVRVLLRDEFTDGSAICVLVSLGTRRVVTVYENKPEELHSSDHMPDMFYAWKDDLTRVVAHVLQTRGLRK